jgi:hypothetical protein
MGPRLIFTDLTAVLKVSPSEEEDGNFAKEETLLAVV